MEANETSPARLSALPDAWIRRIFGELEAYYGSLFLDRWRGTDVAAVKRTWAEKLASFSDDPACFGRALAEVLEGHPFPPTLPEFIDICRRCYRRPVPTVPMLEAKTNPELATAKIAEFKRLLRTAA